MLRKNWNSRSKILWPKKQTKNQEQHQIKNKRNSTQWSFSKLRKQASKETNKITKQLFKEVFHFFCSLLKKSSQLFIYFSVWSSFLSPLLLPSTSSVTKKISRMREEKKKRKRTKRRQTSKNEKKLNLSRSSYHILPPLECKWLQWALCPLILKQGMENYYMTQYILLARWPRSTGMGTSQKHNGLKSPGCSVQVRPA